jgi:tol-pal system protein YbgF
MRQFSVFALALAAAIPLACAQVFAQQDPGDLAIRLDRLENALRQQTGVIEQLQYRNQQLEMQLRQLQQGAMAPQQGGQQPAMQQAPQQQQPNVPVRGDRQPMNQPNNATTVPQQQGVPGRRGDVFDPAQNPNAAGAPRMLGNPGQAAPIENVANAPNIGAPGGREAGAPLDLQMLSNNPELQQQAQPQLPIQQEPVQQQIPQRTIQQQANMPAETNAVSPARPARVISESNTQLATLPPAQTAQDEYDMAYGYVLHKDYSLAEQAFRDFLKKYPQERLVSDATYWLGESQFQQQRYRDAAENFLNVSTKFDKSGKAPDSLLRLGQSLAALNQKEAACATLAEVGRKFPKASASVKRGVTQEQKRVHC